MLYKKQVIYKSKQIQEGRNYFPGFIIFERSKEKCKDCKWNSQWGYECNRYSFSLNNRLVLIIYQCYKFAGYRLKSIWIRKVKFTGSL